MTLEQMLKRAQERLTSLIALRKTHTDKLTAMRGAVEAGDAAVTVESIDTEIAARAAVDTDIDKVRGEITELEAEIKREAEIVELSKRSVPGAPAAPAYDRVGRVESEERTYAPHKEPGFDHTTGKIRSDVKAGGDFERDIAAAFLGDYEAQARLSRHKAEERVERSQYFERAAGTGAFAGLTVPQYLTDLYAPAAAAMRPFADACNRHDLPPAGMTVNLSRITTATSAAIQSSENSGVSETNIDDTLLTINVQTNAGQQTLSRQAIERGTGVEAVVLDDLYRRYHTNLDSTLLNQASTGLAASSTLIPFTTGSPTVPLFYPLTLQGLAAVEAAMLDQASGSNIIVMHSRRWYWLQNGLSSTFPLMAQPGAAQQAIGNNYGAKYGDGIRGILPNGTPVIVDNNVTTAGLAGATTGGTQDHTYVLDQREAHLWEDPSAPVFIRAEQTPAASLGVLFVLYGYFAYTFSRYAQVQQISGTGSVPPTFTGV
jgi:hypothetical protein